MKPRYPTNRIASKSSIETYPPVMYSPVGTGVTESPITPYDNATREYVREGAARSP